MSKPTRDTDRKPLNVTRGELKLLIEMLSKTATTANQARCLADLYDNAYEVDAQFRAADDEPE